MDPGGDTVSALQRTFWRVWYYVTEAVNRFLRPEPTNIINNEPNSFQGPADNGSRSETPEISLKDINSGPDEECKTQLTVSSEDKPSEEGESLKEEQFSQAGNVATLFTPKYEEEDIRQKVYADVDSPEKEECEEHVNIESIIITDNAVRPEEATQETMTPDDPTEEDESVTEIQLGKDNKIHHEDEQHLEKDDIKIKLCTITDLGEKEGDNVHIEEAKAQRVGADTNVIHGEVGNSDGVLELASENKNKSAEEEKAENQVSVPKQLPENHIDVKGDTGQEDASESDKDEEEQGEENEPMLDEEQDEEEDMNEAADSQTLDEEPKQKEDVETVTEDILTQHVTCSKELLKQITETELQAAKERHDVDTDTEVQTKTKETDVVGVDVDVDDADISVNEMFLDQAGEDNKESYIEKECAPTSITVKPEEKTRQETIRELINIPVNMCEGQVVVLQELNSPTCEETQEGVPEYNNEPEPDENTTQRFLEAGNCKEIQTTLLPEEEESRDCESLQNWDCSTGADQILVKEHREEDPGDKALTGVLYLTDTGLPQETDKQLVEQEIQESGLLFEEEDGKLLVRSMKTEIEHSDKEFETHGFADETTTTTEQHDGTEEVFGLEEGLTGSKDAAADVCVAAEQAVRYTDETSKSLDAEDEKMTKRSLFQESIDSINSDQNCNLTPCLQEDITESGFLRESVETQHEIDEHCTVETENAVIDMEETDYELEEEEAEDQMKNKNEMGISPLVETAAKPVKETDEHESVVIAESLLNDAFEISNKNILRDTEAADELVITEFKSADEMAKHVTDSEGIAEESSSISGHQDVIDEEILDLWIQAALPEAGDDMERQEESDPGQSTDTKIEPSNEEQGEMTSVQTEMEKEQLVESNSGESGLMSDTEISLLTAESKFFDQSFCEMDKQNSETGPLKSTSTEPFQAIYDMLASMSETSDISELSMQQFKPESQEIIIEEDEESIANTEFHLDSAVTSSGVTHQNQESDQSQDKTQEERVESAQAEPGSQKDDDAQMTELRRKTDWGRREEAPAESLTKISLEKVEKTKAASDPADEIKRSQSGQSWAEAEKLFKLPSPEKPQAGWSEDVAESLPERIRTEVIEQPTTQFGDLTEVDTSALDFTAQKLRIALKNPHVRPPKDPRSLLHKPSVEPTPASRLPVKVPAGVPLGGLGIGIKLHGLGAGFPVLKKTQHVVREEDSPETSKKPETKPEDKSHIAKQDEAQHKPKWMPPKHPGFGNPLMSELKNKLKKTPKE